MSRLQLGRGLSTAETRAYDDDRFGIDTSFNWAAVFQPRKLVGDIAEVQVWEELQLGRGLSTAETPEAPQLASNAATLQLGRGLSTAETDIVYRDLGVTDQLQLGRGLSTAETARQHK